MTEPIQLSSPTQASPVLDLMSVLNSPPPPVLEPPASSTIVLRNPTDQHPVKVVSFLKVRSSLYPFLGSLGLTF